MGIVCLIDSDADAVRNSGYLACGIDDASIVLLSLSGCQDEQTIG